MVDGEASKRNSRQTDSDDDEEHSKRCVTVDVASRNQTNSRKHESCKEQRLNQSNRPQGFNGARFNMHLVIKTHFLQGEYNK